MPRFSMESLPQKEAPKPSHRRPVGWDLDPYNIGYGPEDYRNGCDPDALDMTESEFFGDIGDK